MHASLDNHSLNWTSRELLRADAKLTDTALARQHGSSGYMAYRLSGPGRWTGSVDQ